MSDGFQRLELSFADKVGTEVRAELERFYSYFVYPTFTLFVLYRHSARILGEVSVLRSVKSLSETCHGDIGIVKESLDEISAAQNLANCETKERLEKLLGKVSSILHTKDVVSPTKISAILALLTEALKVWLNLHPYNNKYIHIFP